MNGSTPQIAEVYTGVPLSVAPQEPGSNQEAEEDSEEDEVVEVGPNGCQGRVWHTTTNTWRMCQSRAPAGEDFCYDHGDSQDEST